MGERGSRRAEYNGSARLPTSRIRWENEAPAEQNTMGERGSRRAGRTRFQPSREDNAPAERGFRQAENITAGGSAGASPSRSYGRKMVDSERPLPLFQFPAIDDDFAARRQCAKLFGDQHLLRHCRFFQLPSPNGNLFGAMTATTEFPFAFTATHVMTP